MPCLNPILNRLPVPNRHLSNRLQNLPHKSHLLPRNLQRLLSHRKSRRRTVDEHHVTPDHSGYPKTIRRNRTAEASRIVMVVDR